MAANDSAIAVMRALEAPALRMETNTSMRLVLTAASTASWSSRNSGSCAFHMLLA